VGFLLRGKAAQKPRQQFGNSSAIVQRHQPTGNVQARPIFNFITSSAQRPKLLSHLVLRLRRARWQAKLVVAVKLPSKLIGWFSGTGCKAPFKADWLDTLAGYIVVAELWLLSFCGGNSGTECVNGTV
jgi:hypothetical protein